MKEDFLHYVWKFQKFDTREVTTVSNELLKVIAVGQHNQNAGPDFFNAQLSIGEQLWAGNLEIHIKSSDWYVHQHQSDPAYDNVILHVVWEHDAEIFRKDNTVIPTLELKRVVASNTLTRYYDLFSKKHSWINCENSFAKVDEFILKNWLERLYVERLEQKSDLILEELKTSNNHWEALLFRMLCKNFGLKVNGEAFYSLARSIDFSVVKKCSQESLGLEALLLGQAGLLDSEKEDSYFILLQEKYAFTKYKFGLVNETVIPAKFFRLRPPNFPTIRLSQLSVLYNAKQNLFSEIISAKTKEDFYRIFDISASTYWDTHYNFGVTSLHKKKVLTEKFIDLLLINTIIPLQFCYAKQLGKDVAEELLQLVVLIFKEENGIVKKYNELRPIANSAFESQALLQLKNEYCNKKRCLQCAVGNAVLKD